jgi:hypothetical protein
MLFSRDKTYLPGPEEALSGGDERWFPIAHKHRVVDAAPVATDVPERLQGAIFRLGCFGAGEEIADFLGAPQFPPAAARQLPRFHSTADRQRARPAPPVRP